MLRVRLLGELTVEVDGQRVEVPSGRTRSLFAWLALRRGSHRRSEVAARFWPDILDTSARASLRTAVWALRKALGPAADDALIATRDRVGISAGPSVWTDLGAFEALVAEGRLREAVEMCRGEVLADFDDEWVLEARSEHNNRLMDVLGQLAVAAEASGEPEAALEWTRRQATVDPLAEDVHRDLIRRLIAAGDRVRAIAAYERLRERLRSQLGLAPSPATRELVATLEVETGPVKAGSVAARSHGRDRPASRNSNAGGTTARWKPGLPFPLPARLAADRDGRFVGRAGELEWLRSAFTDVREAGLPRFALVSGDAGIGKTRLAAEFAAETCGRGAIALYGAAERKALLARSPFVESLRHYVDAAAPSELRERVGLRGHELARLVPEVAERIPLLGARDERSDEAGMRQALDAAAGLLVALAEEVPVVVIIDDLQWAEEADLLLLRHLLTPRTGARLLIVGVTRQDELAVSGALSNAIAGLARDASSQRLRLEGLGSREVETLCREWTGTDELSATIHTESEGNPLFAREMLRHLEESGTELGRERLQVPVTARELISQRLTTASTECVRALEIAAVVGSQFDLAILERISGLEGDELVEVLEEAVRAGLLVEVRDAFERFSFSHALMREALADGLTRTRRARIHARVAATLDALAEEGGDALLAARARHWCEAGKAGDPERAIGLAMRAAEEASSRLAYGEALDLYSKALRLLSEGDQRRRGILVSRAVA
ncbi:MAG TPA: AAA family ATPase, partial [Solirubrobacteraceae bacterium]|nr:AAA family ATPase [Solirubrobacteraceae bacterium]